MSIIYRNRINKTFVYSTNKTRGSNKTVVTNKTILDKIKKYRIPPAWIKVEITLNKSLIAIGFDSVGRKQYVYSTDYIEKKRIRKYCGLIDFINVIPKIRTDILRILKKKSLTKEKIIAILLNIIIICSFRIGTEGNRDKYQSQGISTVTKKEITIGKKDVIIDFIGKKQVRNKCKIVDPQMINILKGIYNTKNTKNTKDNFFKINNSNITITDVNKYLKSFNENVTSKVFRTWLANTKIINKIVHNINILKIDTSTENKRLKIVRDCKKEVAEEMHHTVAVCTKSYLINELIQLFINKPSDFKSDIKKFYKKKNGNTESEVFLINYLIKFCKKN